MSIDISPDPREIRKLEKQRKLQELEESLRKREILWEKRWDQKKRRMAELMNEEKIKRDLLFIDELRREERNEWMIPHRAKTLENQQKINGLLQEGERFSKQINATEEKVEPESKKKIKLNFFHLLYKNK